MKSIKILLSLAYLLATIALLAWLLGSYWNSVRREDGEEEARLGLCLVTARSLPPGTLISEEKDLSEKLCRRHKGEKVVDRSQVVGQYVKAQIAQGERVDPTSLLAALPDPFGQVRVVVKVPDERTLRLCKGDRLLLVRSVDDDKEREVIPPLHQASALEGLEVIELPPAAKPEETAQMIVVAVPAGRVAEAVRLSQGEWSPVLLNADRPCRGRATCPKHQPGRQAPS